MWAIIQERYLNFTTKYNYDKYIYILNNIIFYNPQNFIDNYRAFLT